MQPHGAVRWVRADAYRMEPGSHGERMVAGVARDITGQRRLQDELDRYRQHLEKLVGDRTSQIRALSDRLQLVLSSLAEGIVALDGAGHVRLLNPAAEHLTGWNSEDARGQERGGLLDFEPEAPGVSLPGMLAGLARSDGHSVLLAPTERRTCAAGDSLTARTVIWFDSAEPMVAMLQMRTPAKMTLLGPTRSAIGPETVPSSLFTSAAARLMRARATI